MAKTYTTGTRRPARASRDRDAQRGSRQSGNQLALSWSIPWTTMNFIGLGVGVVVIVIGYLLMNTAIAADPVGDKSIWNNANSTEIAPVILTIGYCVILPFAIFWRKKDPNESEVEAGQDVA